MTRWRPIATTLLCLIGLGLSAFLTWGHYFDQAAISRTCPGAGTTTAICCGCVTTSAESVILGLPVALYGLLYFVAMTVMCLPAAWRSPSMWLARARLSMNIAGIGFVLYLVSVELLQVHKICLYCTGVHIVQFALFLLVITGWYDTGYAQLGYGGGDDDQYEDEAPATASGDLVDA
ncbi:MAG: vitamin K epoxide reductase family protein [Acidimicrobiales bacterium]|jgi:uncharacterized membrane protein